MTPTAPRSLPLVGLIFLALSVSAEPGDIRWQVYADFESDVVISDDPDTEATWNFGQNHASVFLSYGPSQEIGLQADILRPQELFQFLFHTPYGVWTAGRVLIPFGMFDTHSLYGGHPDDGTFLPRLWTDWGVIYSSPALGFFTADLSLTNGMDPTGFQAGGATPRVYAAASDSNTAKALGVRLKAVPIPNLVLVASGSWDAYGSADALLTESLAMGGLDGSYEFDSWILRAGGIAQQIRGTTSYLRWADYFEVGWKVTWDLTFKVRTGQMDTNSLWITAEDQVNVNAGLVWKTDFADFAVMYFRNFTVANPAVVGYDANYHQILFKVLIAP